MRLLHTEDKTEEVRAEEVSDVTQEDEYASRLFKSRRPNFDFRSMNIPDGSVLKFTESDNTITVAGNRRIKYNNDEMSLNEITKRLLGINYNVQATPYWTFEGKTLKEIYDEVNPMGE